MPGVFSKILLVSLVLLSGCANKQIQPSVEPSIKDHVSYRISQVSPGLINNPGVIRKHPYFIVCDNQHCPKVTKKTPVHFVAFNTTDNSTRSDASQKSLLSPDVQKGRTIDGKNTTYLNKTSTLLDKYRVHFDYASAIVSDTFKDLLNSFVNDFGHKFKTIRVTGYTDNGTKPDGTIGNEWLALERATRVKKYLLTLGYPESQILLEAKFLCCYIDSNESKEGRRNNRRAEISLLNFKSNGDSL